MTSLPVPAAPAPVPVHVLGLSAKDLSFLAMPAARLRDAAFGIPARVLARSEKVSGTAHALARRES